MVGAARMRLGRVVRVAGSFVLNHEEGAGAMYSTAACTPKSSDARLGVSGSVGPHRGRGHNLARCATPHWAVGLAEAQAFRQTESPNEEPSKE
jgi:hypothetical protein